MKRGFLNTKPRRAAAVQSGAQAQAVQGNTQPKASERDVVAPVKATPVRQSILGTTPSSTRLPTLKHIQAVDRDLRTLSEDELASAGGDKIIITTIPPRSSTSVSPTAAGASSEVIGRARALKRLFQDPSFPRPIRRVNPSIKLEVRPAPGMGLGVYAVGDIDVGETILVERPLVVAPRSLSWALSNEHEEDLRLYLGPDDKLQAGAMKNTEDALEVIVEGRLSERDRKYFKSLTNSHLTDGSGPLLGRFRSNGFSATDIEEKGHLLELYSAVGRVSSRFNHSCRPNVKVDWKADSFTLQTMTTKPIKAGEQLFVAYTETLQGVAKRQQALSSYGFRCTCVSCTDATPEKDRFRETLSARLQALNTYTNGLLERPAAEVSVRDLVPIAKIKKGLEEDGLDAGFAYGFVLTKAAVVNTKMGRHKEGSASASLGLKYFGYRVIM